MVEFEDFNLKELKQIVREYNLVNIIRFSVKGHTKTKDELIEELKKHLEFTNNKLNYKQKADLNVDAVIHRIYKNIMDYPIYKDLDLKKTEKNTLAIELYFQYLLAKYPDLNMEQDYPESDESFFQKMLNLIQPEDNISKEDIANLTKEQIAELTKRKVDSRFIQDRLKKEDLVKLIKNKKKRFNAMYLSIKTRVEAHTTHANCLLIDNDRNVGIYFDPWGEGTKAGKLDLIKETLSENNYTFVLNSENFQAKDKYGVCFFLTVFFLELILSFPNSSIIEILQSGNKYLQKVNRENFLKHYISYIRKQLEDTAKYTNITLNGKTQSMYKWIFNFYDLSKIEQTKLLYLV